MPTADFVDINRYVDRVCGHPEDISRVLHFSYFAATNSRSKLKGEKPARNGNFNALGFVLDPGAARQC